MDIQIIIEKIDELFRNFNRDADRFTVDYDEEKDGLYCHYTPYVNDCGYAVSDYLLFVGETSQKDLEQLKSYLDSNRIQSRSECDWETHWGWR